MRDFFAFLSIRISGSSDIALLAGGRAGKWSRGQQTAYAMETTQGVAVVAKTVLRIVLADLSVGEFWGGVPVLQCCGETTAL